MVINPTELLGEIKLLARRNEDRSIHSIIFPAMDLVYTDHDFIEFSFDKLEAWNEKYSYSDNIAIDLRKIASLEISAVDENIKKRLKNNDIFNLDTTVIRNGKPITYEAKYGLCIYEFIVDSNQMFEEERNNLGKLMSEISNFVSVIIISSIQIAAVLTKYNLSPNFYNDFHENNNNNPIFAAFQKFFGEEYSNVFDNEGIFEEYTYINITDIIDYIFDMQTSKDSKCSFLLAYFPLYVANFNHDILTEEDLGITLKPKKERKTFSAIDLVNSIMEDQEG